MKWGLVSEFIRSQRLYVWLLIFIISVNAALFLTKKAPTAHNKKSDIRQLWQKKALSRDDLARLMRKNRPLAVVLSVFSFAVLFAIALGLFLDFIILFSARGRSVFAGPAILQKKAVWGIWDVCKTAILFLWFGYILMFIESFLAKVFPVIEHENFRSLLNVTIMDFLICLFVVYFVAYEHKEKLASIGLSLKNFSRNVFYGIAGYFAVIPVLLSSFLFIIWVVTLLRYAPPAQPVLEIFLGEKKIGLIIYLTIFASVAGPIAEEIFFRGFMYKAIKSKWGFKAAIFSSSALFALVHANLVGFLPIMILGMLLAYLFDKTGTLVASCTVHILHNSVMVSLVFIGKALMR